MRTHGDGGSILQTACLLARTRYYYSGGQNSLGQSREYRKNSMFYVNLARKPYFAITSPSYNVVKVKQRFWTYGAQNSTFFFGGGGGERGVP